MGKPRHIVIEHEPMGAPRMTKSDKWKKRDVVVRYHALKDAIRAACATHGYTLGEAVALRFEIPMPAGWSKRKKEEMRGKPHQQRPDWDNLAKGFCDAFNVEDSHVHTAHITKVWADEGRIIILNP
ncbi:RusA family crossover junction endodeoxyribonuclease [Hymenobacter latericus]|uniref:RusA family crossover junction endodeoxyribonuclease n=1 Tax=Hymenobacter sp. YIM 151858-1 TaxID=2987688 RepID=UPI0022260C30|nr:RusA family crossover junction endodeoxyribonuclease [Hymenobacter sp. YIM 151858-1]UYZ60144.1 RusA family crossover junction endodeoxyribonuclease [Hymenobacter sp. YIM 151858-1]